ncbi:hypothetical protein FHS18_000762 [Paenibacillus phyllosphaerae]|uniref:Uncharacterized protein n=1 Tax=Paenibacillus phyllosphaerae TaxID=274593 RepID=A0A7W5FL74_9BACL|nr:hypothetical protein [Paenibacillus phyllosphaerae]MBB3108734.1 hypothetical protein [Paenibacillus phyllosphaerae]
MIREERGSAFLLVVFMILLFMMIGVAILGATIGGAQRAQRSEDNVQTIHLADKALTESVAKIMARFDGKSITPAEFVSQLEDFVAENQDPGDLKTSEIDELKTPGYRFENMCIVATAPDITKTDLYCPDPVAQNSTSSGITDEDSYQTYIKVTASGTVNGVKRELEQRIELSTYPDFLKYAMGSEGDVTVNGAPYFIGDIYTGEMLRIQNVAEYTYHGNEDPNPEAKTQFLYIDTSSDTSGSGDEAIAEGKIQLKTSGNIEYRTSKGDLTNKDNPPYSQLITDNYDAGTFDPANQFHDLDDKIELTETEKFISIDVGDSFIDKLYDALATDWIDDRNQLRTAYTSSSTNPIRSLMDAFETRFVGLYTTARVITIPTEPEVPLTGEEDETYKAEKAAYDEQMKELNDRFSSLDGPIIVDGDLTLDGEKLNKLYYATKDKNDWLIVNGNLSIANTTTTPIPVRANILVAGHVTLSGSIEMDSTTYTLSTDTNEIVDAQIRGLADADGKRRELVMIANGPIDIYRVDSFQPLGSGYSRDSANTLHAFFYTDQKAELYGVGSLFWIYGGFFAKGGLTVNAVLGNTTEPSSSNATGLNFDSLALDGDKGDARFVIDYNKDVFEDQGTGLPHTNTIKVIIGRKELQPVTQ